MVGRTFKRQVIITIVVVLTLTAFSLWLSIFMPSYSNIFDKAPSVVIPIGAAWLAYCWQRRNAFTKALLDIWQKLVSTVQDSIQYTFLKKPTQEQYAKIMHSLSCRTDDIRGAFRNVKEPNLSTSLQAKKFVLSAKRARNIDDYRAALLSYAPHRKKEVGVYPFESLKQIQGVIRCLGYDTMVDEDSSRVARETIIALWQILRAEMLKELDRDFPEFPDTPFR